MREHRILYSKGEKAFQPSFISPSESPLLRSALSPHGCFFSMHLDRPKFVHVFSPSVFAVCSATYLLSFGLLSCSRKRLLVALLHVP